MLIEWTLLNEFETPIKKGDLKYKTTHKLRQKQFNILNDEYWKLLYIIMLHLQQQISQKFGHRIRF